MFMKLNATEIPVPNAIYSSVKFLKSIQEWSGRNYSSPSSHFIKQKCLLRNGLKDGCWIETGTYLGETTRFLSKHFNMVYSIEPEPKLYQKALRRFKDYSGIKLLNGTSEEVLPALLQTLSGQINFWLDGHFSGGATFKGAVDCPIHSELATISSHFHKFSRMVIMIDDIRLCDPANPQHESYPTLDFLVDWARQHKMYWQIEHDIFIMRT
jgi:hypothetical protein